MLEANNVMNEPIPVIDMGAWDFRLLDVSSELYALEDHLRLIENQMQQIQQKERLSVDEYIKALPFESEDRDIAISEYTRLIDCLLPRFFRGAFLMALYAVYESAVTEIARLIQKGQPRLESFDEFKKRTRHFKVKGGFLGKAKKYYKDILRFDLYADEKEWCQIKKLLELRNAFAHTNGRLEMLNKKSRENLERWERQHVGISTHGGFIVCDSIIVEKIFDVVRKSLEDLLSRYKMWDNEHGKKP